MEKQEILDQTLSLLKASKAVMLTTLDSEGNPDTRAMMNFGIDSLSPIAFSTNTSSHKIGQIAANPKACVYVYDGARFCGITLKGEITATRNGTWRQKLWNDGCTMYYPLGVDDPDYTVLLFTPKTIRLYEGLHAEETTL